MSEAVPADEVFCLRCDGAALGRLPESTAEMAFFECLRCRRHYALKRGKSLTFRWLHPISLALHPVLFFPDPAGGESKSAQVLMKGRTRWEIAAIAAEIELELTSPTQTVRDILGNAAPEEKCRDFLAGVVRELRESR